MNLLDTQIHDPASVPEDTRHLRPSAETISGSNSSLGSSTTDFPQESHFPKYTHTNYSPAEEVAPLSSAGDFKSNSSNLRTLRQVRACVREHVADRASQDLHRSDRYQRDKNQQQCIFRKVLSFFFLPQPLQKLCHLFVPSVNEVRWTSPHHTLPFL